MLSRIAWSSSTTRMQAGGFKAGRTVGTGSRAGKPRRITAAPNGLGRGGTRRRAYPEKGTGEVDGRCGASPREHEAVVDTRRNAGINAPGAHSREPEEPWPPRTKR